MVARDLDGSSLQAFWAGISFLLASVVFQPVCTSCSDVFGRKAALYACIALFSAGSIIFGVAKNMRILILGRTVQGVGGGGLEALCEIILTDMTTLRERALWLGIMGFVWAAGNLLGPILGGAFSQEVSWRWIAWINLPLMGVALVLLVPFLKLKTLETSTRAKLRSLDWIGIALFMTGMTSACFGLTAGGVLFSWRDVGTILPLMLGISVLSAFSIYERWPQEAIIPHRIFANRTGAIALGTSTIHGVVLFGVLFYLPIYFEAVIGDRPLRSAVEALALALTVTTFGISCSFAIDYTRKYCWAVWAGWTLTTAGMGILSLLDVNTNQARRVACQLALGIGLGTLFPALTIPTQAAVSCNDNALASGTLVFARQLGAVLGLALGSSIFTNLFQNRLPKILPTELDGIESSNGAISIIPMLKEIELRADDLRMVVAAYEKALQGLWYALTAIAGIGLLASLPMIDISLENDETGRQVFEDKKVSSEKGGFKDRHTQADQKSTVSQQYTLPQIDVAHDFATSEVRAWTEMGPSYA